jgi:hypothetical protein
MSYSVAEGTLLCHLLRRKIMCDFQKWKINATGDIFAQLIFFKWNMHKNKYLLVRQQCNYWFLLYEVTNLPIEWAFKTTYNDNETDKVKHGIKRITSRKINRGHGFKNWNAQMVTF